MAHACTCNSGATCDCVGENMVCGGYGNTCVPCGDVGEPCCTSWPYCFGYASCQDFDRCYATDAATLDVKQPTDSSDAADACANLVSCEKCAYSYVPVSQSTPPVVMTNACAAAEMQSFMAACFS